MRRLVSLLAAALVCTSALHAADNPPAAASITAVSVEAGAGTVIVDGQLNEAVWATAPAVTEFVQRDPAEGAAPSRPTEVKVAYDAGAIYVAVTAREPDGQRIKALLTRRDEDSPSDWIRAPARSCSSCGNKGAKTARRRATSSSTATSAAPSRRRARTCSSSSSAAG